MEQQVLCELRSVSRFYRVRRGLFSSTVRTVKALEKVSLELRRKEVLGLVGESGCGKSTLARLILGLEEPTEGRILFEGTAIPSDDRNSMKAFRKRVQMVFQDPFSSLNPKKTIFQTISQPLRIHKLVREEQLRDEVRKLLRISGIDTPGLEDRYPHEFSGGQRQRICIARALATRPDVIVADEPTSALDVSVQAQIVNLFLDLHETRGISCLFISHDLPLVGFVSHRIAVMYRGNIVEIMPKPAFDLDSSPRQHRRIQHHPYTLYLLKAVPVPDPKIYKNLVRESSGKQNTGNGPYETVKGTKGCVFASRCSSVHRKCLESRPELREAGRGHFIACHMKGTLPGKGVHAKYEI